MQRTHRKISALAAEEVALVFRYNKLLAVTCMLVSASISGSLLFSAIRHWL
jgi:hypothetical protein